MENLNATPAVEQSEPVSQAETAAAISVAPVASTDENAQAEAAELPQSDASAPAAPSLIQRMSEALSGAEAQPLNPGSVFVCDVEDCTLTDAGHRIVEDAVQCISKRAQDTISSVLREDNGEPHDHELARMVDEGGPCPERSLQPGFYRRPQTSSFEQAAAGLSEEVKDQLRSIADQFETATAEAEVKGDTPSFEQRLAEIERGLAELRSITEYHGLRGPQA